jgi:WD40 repeat protein
VEPLDPYGDPLPPFSRARLGTVRWRHRAMIVGDLAFARDGDTVFAAGGGLTALDLATGAIRWSTNDPHAGYVRVVPAPDGDRLVTAGFGVVSLRAAATGALLREAKLPSTSLHALAVSHDGRTIFAGGFGPFGALLDPDGALRATLPVEGGMYLHSAAFSPDDATVVSTDCHAHTALWSVAEGRLLRTFGRADLQPNDAVFTPDGTRLVVLTCGGSVVVFDVATGDTVTRWKAHRASASRVVLTPDGLRAITLGEDNTLSLWSLTDGARLATRTTRSYGTALALSPDGATLALGAGPRVALVDLATFTERAAPDEHDTMIQALAVSRDGAEGVTLAGPGEARWWSLGDGSRRATVALPHPVGGLRALPEAEQYAVMQPHREGTDVLDVSARALRRRPETFDDAHQKWWGRRAHATLLRGRLTLVNAEGAAHTLKAIAHALAFTPDDRHAVFFERSTVTFWDLARHAAVATAKVRAAGGLVLSPGGDEVALWGAGALHRFGVPDGVERAVWKSPTGLPVATAAYAPDGATLAVATHDVVWLVDAARNVELARLAGHSTLVTALAFTPDGAGVVSAGWDTTALVWDLPAAVAGYVPPQAAKRAKRPRG